MYLIDINKENEFKEWDYMIITMSLKLLLFIFKSPCIIHFMLQYVNSI